MNSIQSIILAAGQGTRLKPYTNNIPKAMVKLSGVSLIERQLNTLKSIDLKNFNVVTGYKEECIQIPNVNKIYNPRYATTNMVASLYCAKNLFDGSSDIIISYGDIVFEKKVINALVNSESNISVIVDKGWKRLWQLRMDDILGDAETLKLDKEQNIVEIGKKPKDLTEIQGQYIGLIKISKNFAQKFFFLYELLASCDQLFDGKDHANMYMTSYIQLLINTGIPIKAVFIENGWLEVDTKNDLETYERLYSDNALQNICKLS